jgi:drug/metabolite transporter (DMT)-like permease
VWQHAYFRNLAAHKKNKLNKKWSSAAMPGILMVMLSAFLFSGKAVLAKLVYHEVEMSVGQLLVIRMFFSLPFYMAMLAWQWHRYNQTRPAAVENEHPFFPVKYLRATMLLGLLGYYVSSFFDFWGLKFISAGLERVILFSYPTFVVLFGALLFKTKIFRHQIFALLLSYAGIGIAFAADLQMNAGPDVWKGTAFIVGCAITFSLYVLYSGKYIPRVGVGLFTAVAMLSATAAIFLHYVLAGNKFSDLFEFSNHVYFLMLLMAVFTTVVPSFLVRAGVQRIGSANVAIISSIGPIITIAQAWYFLGEPFGWLQVIGTIFVVAGVLLVSRKAEAIKK